MNKEKVRQIKKRKKAWVDKRYCAACGVCMNNCVLGAITIQSGMYAKVNEAKCVGCMKCVKLCPASTIEMIEGESHE